MKAILAMQAILTAAALAGVAAICVLVFSGCKTTEKQQTGPQGVRDAIQSSGFTMTSPHKIQPSSAKITRTLTSAHINRDKKRIDDVHCDIAGWRSDNSTVDKNISGRLFIYWENGGQWFGGQADHWRPRDTLKTLTPNCYPGGNYWTIYPPRGATVYACIFDNELHERTNIVKCDGPW